MNGRQFDQHRRTARKRTAGLRDVEEVKSRDERQGASGDKILQGGNPSLSQPLDVGRRHST